MRNSRSRSAAKRTFLPESGGGAVWGVGLFSGECVGRSVIRVKCVPVVELRCRAPSRMRGPSRYVQASTDQVVLAIRVSHLRQGSYEGAQAPLFGACPNSIQNIVMAGCRSLVPGRISRHTCLARQYGSSEPPILKPRRRRHYGPALRPQLTGQIPAPTMVYSPAPTDIEGDLIGSAGAGTATGGER